MIFFFFYFLCLFLFFRLFVQPSILNLLVVQLGAPEHKIETLFGVFKKFKKRKMPSTSLSMFCACSSAHHKCDVTIALDSCTSNKNENKKVDCFSFFVNTFQVLLGLIHSFCWTFNPKASVFNMAPLKISTFLQIGPLKTRCCGETLQ